jgi:GTP:adenosylcobinamide-phosphate guanylyltransferase
MKEIKLTQDKIALVDDEDFEYLNQFKWCVSKSGHSFYAQTIRKVKIRMHREIMKTQLENNIGKIIDHIDGNGLNNQKYNLRTCTRAENGRNRHSVNNSSGYLGVFKIKSKKEKWKVQIVVNKKSIYIGTFKDKKDAAKAYNEAAIKYHGEFARPNIIDDDENKINNL